MTAHHKSVIIRSSLASLFILLTTYLLAIAGIPYFSKFCAVLHFIPLLFSALALNGLFWFYYISVWLFLGFILYGSMVKMKHEEVEESGQQ